MLARTACVHQRVAGRAAGRSRAGPRPRAARDRRSSAGCATGWPVGLPQLLERGQNRAALRVAEDDDQPRAEARRGELDAPDLRRRDDVAGHADDEQVAQALVEHDLGRHARIGAAENDGERLLRQPRARRAASGSSVLWPRSRWRRTAGFRRAGARGRQWLKSSKRHDINRGAQTPKHPFASAAYLTRSMATKGAAIEQSASGTLTGWSAEAEALFGWSTAEAVGQPSHILIPVRNRPRHDAGLTELIAAAERGKYIQIITGLHKDGREFPVEFTMSAVTRPQGTRLIAIARPAAPQARSTGDALASDARFRDILDQIEDACSVVDLRGNYLYVNEAFCRTFGFKREHVLGANFRTVSPAERSSEFHDVYTQVYQTGEPNRGFEFPPRRAGRRAAVLRAVDFPRAGYAGAAHRVRRDHP